MDSRPLNAENFQLGPFRIKGKENLIETLDREIVVLPKVMALLLYLCRNGQQVATFDDLNAAIWPNEVVGDNAIYNLVGQLRKVLGDRASDPAYIQTVSKAGYRLLVNAEPIGLTEPVQRSEPAPENSQTGKSAISRRSAVVALIALVLLTTVLWLGRQPQPQPSPEYERQLKLARYQLYRGDPHGVDQAIDTLQALAAFEPHMQVPRIEIAYGFIRKSRIDPNNREFWLNKAAAVNQGLLPGDAKQRLSAVIRAAGRRPDHQLIDDTLFAGTDTLISARLAYSELLFEQGNIEDAALQAEIALQDCLDCPYIYRKLATAQVVLGEERAGFGNFENYRTLINRSSDDPLDNAGNIPLTMKKLEDMAHWHYARAMPDELLTHQRNTLALFYLSLGKVNSAQNILTSSPQDSTQFYDLYTHAAIAGAKGQFEKSHGLLQKRQKLYPDNRRFRLSVVFSLWQLGQDEKALERFLAFGLLDTQGDVPMMPEFEVWSLYGALLMENGQRAKGMEILTKLESQLQSGVMPGSQLADIRLASILALLGRHDESLYQLQTAIEQGWVSDFNQNWWYLQGSPYFRSLASHPRFKQIHSSYQQRLKDAFGAAAHPSVNENSTGP